MKRSRLVLLVVLSAALSAGLTSWLTRQWQDKPPKPTPQTQPNRHDQDFHRWLHTQLELTPEQEKALQPAEERFEAQHRRLLDELETASTQLAHALGETTGHSPELEAAMEKRNQLQFQIQRLVVSHLLEKRDALSPGQRQQFRRWIHESISHDHGH